MEENASETENAPSFEEPPETTSQKTGDPPDHDPQFDFGNIFRDIDGFIDDRLKSGETTSSEIEDVPESVAKFLNLVEGIVIGRCDDQSRWNEVPEGDMLFLESVDRISKLVTVLSDSKPKPASKGLNLLNRIGKIQQRAMSFLEDQLRSLLEPSHSNEKKKKKKKKEQKEQKEQKQQTEEAKVDEEEEEEELEEQNQNQTDEPEQPKPEQLYPEYQNDVVSSVKAIASRMLSGGYAPECRNVYKIARQNALDDVVYRTMGFERVSMDDMQKMNWEALERDIATWIRTCKQCVVVYFPGELRLANEVFKAQNKHVEIVYRSILRTVLIHLVNFAEAVAMLKRTTEKLFKVLDMYETMRDTILSLNDHHDDNDDDHEYSSLFPHESTRALRAEAATARSRLGEAAVCIFFELDSSIRAETGKTAVPGGAVHPLTRYTMNYLNYACQYKETLEQVFADHARFERSDSTSGDEAQRPSSPFATKTVKIMNMLEANLEAKSKLYKDQALSSIFMMNNGRYILQKIEGSPEIGELMGGAWSRKMYAELMNYHRTYQRETWNKLLGCLVQEGLMHNNKVLKPVVKERFKNFSSMFEEIYKTQSTWVVSDEQLQTELRISISSLVVPAYRSFMGRYSQYLDPGKQYQKYIKFQPEDLETHIDDLFDGSANANNNKKK